ncbi:hypothetical protein [Neorhizobium sp. NCHU2750]|uniref:hypothetical protein n=1 Tax=Neorhizobium sp. NCHU2750 TaxID=1825976 RepID=UPI000E730FC6|nr:hypothetical protein NCHU2750_06250 [Neorhizobium sp. NCHU2750]
MALVSVDQVNLALRLDLAENDARISDVELKIGQAEDIMYDFLKSRDQGWTSGNVPGRVSAAIIMIVQSLFDETDTAKMLSDLASGTASNPIVGLLYRLRDPALA